MSCQYGMNLTTPGKIQEEPIAYDRNAVTTRYQCNNTSNNSIITQTTHGNVSSYMMHKIQNSRQSKTQEKITTHDRNAEHLLQNNTCPITPMRQSIRTPAQLSERVQDSHLTSNEQSDHSEWFGDILQYHKGWNTGDYTSTIRVCSVNINGISRDLQWLEWETLLKDMYLLQIDIMGVVEPNINFNNYAVLLRLKEKAKSIDRGIQLATSCSNQLNSSTKKWEVQ
jgi:hypothetical protein